MAKRMKKALSLILALVMILSLVNITALAAGRFENQIVSDGQELTIEDGKVIQSKTIKQTGTDTFDITLMVKTLEEVQTQVISQDAAVVLVLDVSNSMNDKVGGAQKLGQAKAAAEAFVDAFVQDAGEGSRMVSIVEFGANAKTVSDWVDANEDANAVKNSIGEVTIGFQYTSGGCDEEGEHTHTETKEEKTPYSPTAAELVYRSGRRGNGAWYCPECGKKVSDGRNRPSYVNHTCYVSEYVEVEVTYNGPHGQKDATDSGGTNIEGGLRLANNLLGSSAVSGIKNTYVVLLTDGVPTYHVDDDDETGSTSFMKGSSGGGSYATHDDYHDIYCTQTNQGYGHIQHGDNIPQQIKNKGAKLYTVAYDLADGGTVNSMTAKNWLAAFSTQMISADSDIFEGLGQVAEIIMNQAKAWILNDPMGDLIEFVPNENSGVVVGNTEELESSSAVLEFNTDTNTLTWDLKSDVSHVKKVGNYWVYEFTYSIKLDTADQNFDENKEGDYPTNGTTTLTYMLTENGVLQPDLKSTELVVPVVKGKTPVVDYAIEYYKWDKNTGAYPTQPTESTPGSAKLWTTVNAPEGYANKYNGSNYYWVGGASTMTLTPDGENVLRLYYMPVSAQVTVNHFYTTTEHYYEGGELKSRVVEDSVLRNPVTESAYVGDSYTAAEVTTASDGKGDYTLTEGTKTIRVSRESGENVINLHYAREYTVGDTTSVTVNHNWTLNTYTVVNGVLTLNTTNEKKTQTTSGLYVNSSYTAYQDSDLIEGGYTNSGEASQAIVLNQDGNVINFNYTKTVYPDPATATVKYQYVTNTVSYDENGIEQTTTDSVWGETATINGYHEEVKTPDDRPQHNGDTYTRVTGAFTITLDKDNAAEYTIQYERTVYPEEATVTVTHHYAHYVWQTETDDEGNITGGDWILAAVQPEDYVVTPTGTFYAGQHYLVSEDLNGLTGYEYKSGPKGEQILVPGANSYDLFYEWYENDEDDSANVTVYHNYYQKVSYINEDGQVAERVDTIAEGITEENDHFEGLKGEPFIAVEKLEYDSKGYTRIAPTSLSGILQSWDATMDINYMAKDVLDEKVPTTVTVTHTYETYTTYVDENGILVEAALTDTISGDTETITNLYEGQSYTAVPKTTPVIEGVAADDGKGIYATVTTDLTIDPLGETNEINVVYKRYVNDDLTATDVTVKHVYQTLVKEVVNGEYKEYLRDDTDNSHDDLYDTGLYAGMTFTATPDSVEGTEYVRQTADADLTLFPLGESGTNVITISYLATMPDVGDAKYVVVHQYNSYDYLGSLIEDSAYTYETRTDEITVENGDGVNVTVNEVLVANYENEGESTQTLALSKDAVTVFTFVYSRTIINPTEVTVIHNYYKDAESLAAGEDAEASYQETVTEVNEEPLKEGGSYTAALRTENNGLAYAFNSADPAGYTIAVLAPKGGNTITISYVRADTEYTVTHVYRTNGSEVGRVNSEHGGKVGDIVNAADVEKLPVYNGSTYTYTTADKESITLTADGASNAITLYYDRTTGTIIIPPDTPTPDPVDPPAEEIPDEDVPLVELPEEPVEEIPEEEVPLVELPEEPAVEIPEEEVPLAEAPKTGDNLGLWFLLAASSGLGLVWMTITGKKRKDEDA